MAYESELALNLFPYVAGEQPKDRKFIKLNTNENPYPPSPKVAEAIAAVPQDALRLYPDMDATALREAIAKVNGIMPDMVFCGNGSDEVLAFAFAAFFAGKTLTAPDVTYSFYPVYAELFGVGYNEVPMNEDLSVNVQEMLLAPGPIALANPNAPTGLLLDSQSVRKLAAHCLEKQEVLLIDEAYAAFAPETAIGLLAEYDNILITRTFSKSHALAGMRVGYAIGSPRLIRAMRDVKDSFNSYPLDRLAQAAAEASILDTAYTEEKVRLICEARDKCRDTLRAARIPVLTSATNFLFVQADPYDAAPVMQELRNRGILVRHFKAGLLKAWLRVTVGTTEEMVTVTEALLDVCKKMRERFTSTTNMRTLQPDNWRFVRSDVPGEMPEDERQMLIDRHVTTIIDLRTEAEQKKRCALEDDRRFKYLHMPLPMGNTALVPDEQVTAVYLQAVTDQTMRVVDAIWQEESNVLFCCSDGAQQTSVVAALLLRRLGASDKEIIEDYTCSWENARRSLEQAEARNPDLLFSYRLPSWRCMQDFLDQLILILH